MPSSVTVTPRLIHKEDLATTTTPNETQTVEVAGLGNTLLHKIDALFLSDLVSAANDTAAGTAGVNVGEIYRLSTTGKLRTRMS